GTSEGLAALDPKLIPDDNVIWSFHSYAPFLLTHQGATWAGDFIPHVTGLPYPLDSVSPVELDAIVETIRQRIRRDAPLMRRAGLLAYLDEQIAAVDTPAKLAAAMDAPFAEVAAWAAAHGVAAGDIMLGEFGMIRQEYGNDHVMPAATRAAYYRDMIALAEKHGFAWSMWDYGGAFGVVDEFDGRRAEPEIMEMIRALK
ncbi:MAG: cellulase family glycosylhydrolase, partial [Mesorhizobium sp.]|nr:cellulase family glycosylhydrolase [Mesorhizobium sp.]